MDLMNMRTTFDPYAGNDPLVDKMIGNAYDVVALVAKNLQAILFLGDNMTELMLIAKGLRVSTVVLGVAGQVGELISIPLPTGVTADKVVASSVLIATPDGSLYGSDYFTCYIAAGALKISLNLSAPPALVGSVIRWYLTYGV
jgi:hypothetical protein